MNQQKLQMVKSNQERVELKKLKSVVPSQSLEKKGCDEDSNLHFDFKIPKRIQDQLAVYSKPNSSTKTHTRILLHQSAAFENVRTQQAQYPPKVKNINCNDVFGSEPSTEKLDLTLLNKGFKTSIEPSRIGTNEQQIFA